jgi:protein-tyrosine phosphatase
MSVRDVDMIIPHLYLTNWESSNDQEVLIKYNIVAVVTVETSNKPIFVINFYKNHNIKNFHIRLHDHPDQKISDYFDSSYEFINYFINRGENLLVHCRAGISRSTTIIVNYLLRKRYENSFIDRPSNNVVSEILNFIRTKRAFINPNTGFINQLVIKGELYSKIKLWPLFVDDLQITGDLKNNLTSVVLFCEHNCDISKFTKLGEMLYSKNIKVYMIKNVANYSQYKSIEDPFIVGMYKGEFFSEYGKDPNNPELYGDLKDLEKYSLELGKDNIIIHVK